MTVLQNCGPFGIWIERDNEIGFADEMNGQDKMDYKFINTITNQIKINTIREDKAKKWTTEAKQEHVDNLANISLPQEYKAQYKQLLVKHFAAISIDKNDLGIVKGFFHKIHVKDNELVYRKPFKIPYADRPFLEESLAEWLKL